MVLGCIEKAIPGLFTDTRIVKVSSLKRTEELVKRCETLSNRGTLALKKNALNQNDENKLTRLKRPERGSVTKVFNSDRTWREARGKDQTYDPQRERGTLVNTAAASMVNNLKTKQNLQKLRFAPPLLFRMPPKYNSFFSKLNIRPEPLFMMTTSILYTKKTPIKM